MINTEAERIQKAIDAIEKERPEYGQILGFFGKVMIKLSEFSDEVKVEPVSIERDEARAKLEKGTPLLNREDFRIDVSNASQLFDQLFEMLRSQNPELSDEFVKIEEAREKGNLILEEMFRSVLVGEHRVHELAEELSLDEDIILMLATLSIKPSLEANASQVRDMVEDASWAERYCPVCGSSPAMSELRERNPPGPLFQRGRMGMGLQRGRVDTESQGERVSMESQGERVDTESQGERVSMESKKGRIGGQSQRGRIGGEGTTSEGAERILHCSFCGSEWRTMRLACAFCGNTDSGSMGYLFTEEEKGYRIDVCEKCKKYIKTVDCRKISHEIVLPVEDISTLHLDIIAEEEGYKREAWLMPYGIR